MRRVLLGMTLLALIAALSRGSLRLAPGSWSYELPGAFTLKVTRTADAATAVFSLAEEAE